MTIDYNKYTEYSYDPLLSRLSRVKNSVSRGWSEYKYNPDNGHFIGFRSGEGTEEKFNISYKENGVGLFLTTEMPGDKIMETRYDSNGNQVWHRSKGQLPVFEKMTRNGVVNQRSIFRDDVVSIFFNSTF